MAKLAYLKNTMRPSCLIIIMFQNYSHKKFYCIELKLHRDILALASCRCNFTTGFHVRCWWMGLHNSPFSWHLAMPVWHWKVCWDSQFITPLLLLCLLKTNVRNELVGFWKAELLTVSPSCCLTCMCAIGCHRQYWDCTSDWLCR